MKHIKTFYQLNESLNEATEYAVMLTGGSIGDKPRPKDPRGYVGVEVSADERLYSKDDAKETAKRMNKDLSPGEKRYYGLKYVVVPVANGKFVRENVITEGQALIFDIVEPEFNDLKGKLNDLNKKTVDLKWRKALDQIQREVEKLEFFISKYDKQLGAIETNESLNEREYSEEQRMSMADKGLALPDGSFPIKDLEDLKNAVQAYGRSKDQAAAAKFIAKRAKELSAEDLIPDTEDFQKSLKETVNEGNAFLAARSKAIEEDAEEFEFNGKIYPILNRPKKLNEMLSDRDAYKIIDAGSKFSDEVGGQILATQTFKNGNELVDYLLSDFIDQKDHAKFLKSVKNLIEGIINEASKINVKDIKVGSILNFNDGETWKVTKFIGNPSNPRGVFALPHGDTKKNYVSVALEFTIDELEKSVNSLNEATTSWAKLMKGVKSSETGPWSIVAIDNKKVVGQKIDIRTQEIIPANYEAMRKEYPNAKIHIEDGTGAVVWYSK